MIKILITDDSATETALLKHIFEAEKDMTVIACAKNGQEALELAAKLHPDLITMDIQMPVMDGYEATRRLMMEHPVPIVVISQTVNHKELNTAFKALEAGAVCVLEKPKNVLHPDFHIERDKLISTIRAMAEIRVIKHRFSKNQPSKKPSDLFEAEYPKVPYEIIVMGASVGGPQALKSILSALPVHFSLPIVIVQHMAKGFMTGFCEWMGEHCHLRVKCMEPYELLQGGTVYFAPEQLHLQINRVDNQLQGHLQAGLPVSGFCPSISLLFESVANVCGKNAIGVLLTGMGKDGAQGLLAMKRKQALTIIQDEKSSIVFGMASVAQSLGAVDKVIAMEHIVEYLCRVCP